MSIDNSDKIPVSMGLITRQSSPPLPQPNAGMAMLFKVLSFRNERRAISPVAIYSFFEGFFQFLFVGKLMMVFSPVSRLLSFTPNNLPVSNSPFLQASRYFL